MSRSKTQARRVVAQKGTAAWLGNKCHEVLQLCLNDHNTVINRESLKRGIQVYNTMKTASREVIGRVQQISKQYSKLYTQIPFGYNCLTKTVTVLGSYGTAQYGTVIAGTADFVFTSVDKLFVGDWKTGMDDIPAPGQNLQLAVLAEMAASYFNIDRSSVLVCIANPITGQIEIAKPLRFELHQLDYDFVNKIKIKKTPSAGACRYCPMKSKCDEFHKYSLNIINELEVMNELRNDD